MIGCRDVMSLTFMLFVLAVSALGSRLSFHHSSNPPSKSKPLSCGSNDSRTTPAHYFSKIFSYNDEDNVSSLDLCECDVPVPNTPSASDSPTTMPPPEPSLDYVSSPRKFHCGTSFPTHSTIPPFVGSFGVEFRRVTRADAGPRSLGLPRVPRKTLSLPQLALVRPPSGFSTIYFTLCLKTSPVILQRDTIACRRVTPLIIYAINQLGSHNNCSTLLSVSKQTKHAGLVAENASRPQLGDNLHVDIG